MTTSIETYSGGFFDYVEPRSEDVDVRDIARALSMTVRFAGHVERFFSVAEHAVNVSDHVADCCSAEMAYAALHHDSHEAYVVDLPSPLKRLVGPVYEMLALEADVAICEALDLNYDLFSHDIIKEADRYALLMEANALKKSRGVGEHWGNAERVRGHIDCWPPHTAERRFLDRHFRLRRELGLDKPKAEKCGNGCCRLGAVVRSCRRDWHASLDMD